jgi:hypothetical protein
MKLCPQCEFLYEDDQIFCDMDGEGLVYDSRAEVFSDTGPVTSASPKQPWPRFMIGAVLAGLLLSALLSFAYYAATRPVTVGPASGSLQPEPNLSRQKAAGSVDDSSSLPGASPSQSPLDTASASPAANAEADTSVSRSAPTQTVSKARDNVSSTGDNRLMISKGLASLPKVNPLPQLPSPQRLPAAKATATMPVTATSSKQKIANQTTTETSQKSVIVEVKPTNVTKRSKVGAFFKKTGRILAKPFKR